MSVTPVTKCPKCASQAVELAAFSEARPEELITCPTCGHRARKDEFLAELLGKAAKTLQDAFRDVPGFKSE